MQSMERNTHNGLHIQLKLSLERFLNDFMSSFSQLYSGVASEFTGKTELGLFRSLDIFEDIPSTLIPLLEW